MVRSTLRRTLPLLVLCLLLAAPGISTAAPRAQSPAGDLLGWLRGALVSLWSKNGCQADPFGQCITTATPKAGCRLDPFGHCITTSTTGTTKNGCQADPHGGCLDGLTTTPTTEAGCELDPFGRCRN
jgi:hypothetical protein